MFLSSNVRLGFCNAGIWKLMAGGGSHYVQRVRMKPEEADGELPRILSDLNEAE